MLDALGVKTKKVVRLKRPVSVYLEGRRNPVRLPLGEAFPYVRTKKLWGVTWYVIQFFSIELLVSARDHELEEVLD